MIVAAWICLLLPLAGALALTLAGNLLPKRVAGILATSSVAGAFVAAVVAFVLMLGESPEERAHVSTAFTWLSVASFSRTRISPIGLPICWLLIEALGMKTRSTESP